MPRELPCETSVREAMTAFFDQDTHRIEHTLQVTSYAKELLESFPGANPEIVVFAALLHDIGIKPAEEKHGTSAPRFQEMEGPPVAKAILAEAAAGHAVISAVADIVGHHHTPGVVDTVEFRIVYDSDWLVNLPDVYDLASQTSTELTRIIDQVFLTNPGRTRAKAMYLPSRKGTS